MFEFYNNSVFENSSHGFLSIFISVLLTGIVSALIVIFSQNLEKKKKKEQDGKLELDNLKYVLRLCKQSLSAFGIFKESLEKFCIDNETKHHGDYKITEFDLPVIGSIIRICKVIDQERAYYAYKNVFKTDELIGIFIYFDAALGHIEDYIVKYDRIYELVTNLRKANDETFTGLVYESLQSSQNPIEKPEIDHFGDLNLKGYLTVKDIQNLKVILKTELPFDFLKRNSDVHLEVKEHFKFSQRALKENVLKDYQELNKLITQFENNLKNIKTKTSWIY